jgi:hypothetical protein
VKPALLLLAALSLGVSPAAAQAPASAAPFETFKRVCVDTGGEYARVVAAPELQSWSKFPLPLPLPIKDVKIARKSIRAKTLGGGAVLMFFAGDGQMKTAARTVPFQMCAIGGKPADLATALRQVQGWTGQAPVDSGKGVQSFRFHEAGGKRTPLKGGKLKEALAGLGAGRVVSVEVAPQKDTTMISYTLLSL